jgi:hypothetical protein
MVQLRDHKIFRKFIYELEVGDVAICTTLIKIKTDFVMGLFSNIADSFRLNNDAADFALYYDRYMKNYDIFINAY